MSIACIRCNRRLVRPPVFLAGLPYGPTCAASMMPDPPRRARGRKATAAHIEAADARQQELFAEVQP